MPPKKKSGKKKSSGKKKKGKKSSASKEPKLTVEEAIIAFQIEVKQRNFEDLMYNLQSLKEKNERLKDRNQQLKEEQLQHIKTLLKQVKEKDKEVENAAEVGHEQVEVALLEKFDLLKAEEAEVQAQNDHIEKKEAEIKEVLRNIRRLQEYRDIGAEEHAKQIVLLKQDLKEMQDSQDDIAAHLERSLKIAKDEIETYTESTISKQKDIANEKATNKLDKDSCGEILDHRWLKKEVAIHRQGHADLSAKVEDLEKRNLEIMSEMFDCKVEDLKFTRQFYLSCVEDEDSSEEDDVEDDGEEVIALHGVLGEQDEKPDDLLDNYFFPGEDDFQDSPRLGPMELQLLSVIGTRKPAFPHPLNMDPEAHELAALPGSADSSRPGNYTSPRNWPITNTMLQSLAMQ
ncbi:coiled-coil domain-containing protein 83-like [Stylophora pistillata]|uniref:Coiled-coil domain-containing protein 83 n=1 Tax=Stylophora pistillata TaxID=50429 RepID=A0A2B4S1K4_STYPI|nr:coiled-coil domain-containing protein 83-like [Stylophora pistillata]PFX22933.1 Coiled-coil domain-containing protein 83 [Stylophora pistillata]